MKKIFLLFLLLPVLVKAQKNIDGLINAEKSFAAMALQQGTRSAFLHYLDSNGVVFEKGKAVNGKAVWQARPDNKARLEWGPERAEISSSGDFGYTTGPWNFRKEKPTDSILASGQYNTVWWCNEKGEWRFLTDLGISTPSAREPGTMQKFPTKPFRANPANNMDLRTTEEAFIALVQQDRSAAYLQFLAEESLLERNGSQPAVKSADKQKLIDQTPIPLKYTITGTGMAVSKDLGYVYGSFEYQGKTENYLRIWRKEDKGWKIALEAIRL
jgi:ketosteroid isomerase-like protein